MISRIQYISILLFCFLLCLPFFTGANLARQSVSDAQIKLAYIFQFFQNVEWPEEDDKEFYYLGVFSDDPDIIAEANKLAQRQINRIPIVPIFFRSFDELHNQSPDLLYVDRQYNNRLLEIQHIFEGQSVLIVTNEYRFSNQIMINFTLASVNPRRITFEVNQANIASENLRIRPVLLLTGGTLVDLRELYLEQELELRSKQLQIEDQQEKLLSKEMEILEKEGQIQAQLQDIEEQNAVINLQKTQIQRQQKLVDSQLIKIQEQTQVLETLEEEIQNQIIRQDEILNTMATQSLAVQQQKRIIEEQNLLLEDQRKEEELKNARLSQLSALIESRENELQEKIAQIDKQSSRIETQRSWLFITSVAIFLFGFLLFIIYKNFKDKQRINLELESRNKDIEAQNKQITEQKEKLQKQTDKLTLANIELEKLSLVAKKTDNVVAILNETGSITWCNTAFTNYYFLGELKTQNTVNKFTDFHSEENLKDILTRVKTEKEALSFETYFENQTSEISIFYNTLSFVGGRIGEENTFILIQSNITKLKKTESALKDLNLSLEKRVKEEIKKSQEKDILLVQQNRLAAMGEMIGNIAHQWKQPLSALSLLVQNLLDSYEYDALDQKMLEGSVNKSLDLIKYMSNTVNDFQNFFKPDKEVLLFDIAEVVEKSCDLVENSFKKKSIYLEREMTSDLLMSKGFPNEYMQVVINVLSNARDELVENQKKKSVIKISSYKKENKCVLKIYNDGNPIPNDIKDRIFEPYFSTKDESKGTGLGLYMSKTIIEKNMDGSLYFENVNGGVEFFIELPYALEA